ncbi:MAG: hypothetical protein VB934_12815 [Polyangiaceae bacterium]
MVGAEGIRTRELQGGKVVEIRWFYVGNWIYLVVFCAFVVVLGSVVATRGQFGASHKAVMMGGMILISYFVGTRLLNVTYIHRRGEILRVEHGPLPIGGVIEIRVADIRRVTTYGRRLQLVGRDGQEHIVMSRLSVTQAERLPRILQEELGIGLDDSPAA